MKKNNFKTILSVVISLLIALFFIYLTCKNLDYKNLIHVIKKVNYGFVLASAFFAVLAYWVRAIRWNLLLEPMHFKCSSLNALWSISFGYLMNLTIPRSGEIARSTALYKLEKIPVNKSFGTIISERIVDLIFMLIFILITLFLKFSTLVSLYAYISELRKNNTQSFPFLIPIFSILVIMIFIILMFRKKIIQTAFLQKIISFFKGIWIGCQTVFLLKNKVKFITLSSFIWICYFLSAYLICFSLPETRFLDIGDGFFIIVVGTLGMMIPASGGIGTYHFAMKIGFSILLTSYGFPAEKGAEIGLSYAFISHTMQLVISIAMGMISLIPLYRNKI